MPSHQVIHGYLKMYVDYRACFESLTTDGTQMIVLATPSRPFQVTAKGTPRRQAILEDYAQDIDTAYVAFDRAAAPTSAQVHREISVNDALEIVRGHVHTNVGPNIFDHDNIFDAGADRYGPLIATLPA
jgi:hypothetical protein